MQNNKTKYLVTAALTYANGYTHLGHIAGVILPADIYTRFRRLNKDDIILIGGSDEYGTAIEMIAIKDNVAPQDIIDKYHFSNKQAYEDLGISFDNYSRTSLDIHRETAQEFFLELYNKGLLYEKTEKQLYSEKEKKFLADRFVEGTCPVCGYEEARGDQCENCGSSLTPLQLINPRSKISGDTPVVKESTHLYFPLSKYQDKLKEWLDSKKDWKPNVINYCKGWFKTGLQDRAVTRDLDWGVKVPLEKYKDKVIYVWIEAPVGYISSTKELFINKNEPGKWKDYWCDTENTKLIHFLGKDNVIFHAIIFPAMLMAHEGFVLPGNIPANEFLNLGGAKFSKSKGVGFLLKDALAELPADVIRYTIASNMPENKDTDLNPDDFRQKNNNELAAILGNFINRTIVFAKSKFENKIPPAGNDKDILDYFKKQSEKVASHYEKYKFKDALLETMDSIRAANKYFNDSEPWKVIKEDREKCAGIINNCLQVCYSIAVMISPVLPFTSDKILRILNADKSSFYWENIGKAVLKSGPELGNNEILFPQIEEPEEKPGGEDSGEEIRDNLITIDDFKRIELRVAKVIEAEAVPKSKKLLKLKVKAGDKEKQILAGISEHYTPEEIKGRHIVIVDNLKAAKLMGMESQGMLLAAKKDGKLTIITVDGDIDDGAEVS